MAGGAELTDDLATALDACIIENFADLYIIEKALARIEKKFDLDDPAVIAGLATCADITAVQQRLTVRPPEVLATGLKVALGRKSLRATATLLIRALLLGAELEAAAGTSPPPPKKLPLFTRSARLPAPVTAAGKPASASEVDALVTALSAAKPGEPPPASFTPASLTALGRALAFGWLSHGSEPKHVWAAFAAGLYPDDATAKDLGLMARELGPRVGQFKKAQVLVDVLATMNTPAALEALNDLATKVKTASVRDRARAAFDAAAKRMQLDVHGLADRLIREDAPSGKDFIKRLEQRMVTGSTMSGLELVENVLQRKTARTAARGIVFAAGKKSFTIGDGDGAELIDVAGKPFTLAGDASVVVMHPLDLPAAQLAKWRKRVASHAPAWQLGRTTHIFASPAALTKELAKRLRLAGEITERPIHGLLALGWSRGPVPGGVFTTLVRTLEGIEVVLELDPGVYAGRGMAQPQRVTKLTAQGKGSRRALSEIARELETLVPSK